MPVKLSPTCTAQKLKFSNTDFFGKCDQIRRKLRIWSQLLKKSLIEENVIFCAVMVLFFAYLFFWYCNKNYFLEFHEDTFEAKANCK